MGGIKQVLSLLLAFRLVLCNLVNLLHGSPESSRSTERRNDYNAKLHNHRHDLALIALFVNRDATVKYYKLANRK